MEVTGDDLVRALRAYLVGAERRAIVGVGGFCRIFGAWVSPSWFMQDALRDRDDRFTFTARCEAALHGVQLGPAWEGRRSAEIDGVVHALVWRRDLGLIPALCELG